MFYFPVLLFKILLKFIETIDVKLITFFRTILEAKLNLLKQERVSFKGAKHREREKEEERGIWVGEE